MKLCDHDTLIQLLCFWTLYIALLLFKKHNVSDTGFSLRLQVKPTEMGPIDRASPYLRPPVPAQGRLYKPNTEQTICESRYKILEHKELVHMCEA
jgi:hypothetical protein